MIVPIEGDELKLIRNRDGTFLFQVKQHGVTIAWWEIPRLEGWGDSWSLPGIKFQGTAELKDDPQKKT